MLKCILTLAALAWRRGVAGVDALATDALGRLSLTPEGMAARDTLMLDGIRRTGVPLVIEQTVDTHERTFRLAAQLTV